MASPMGPTNTGDSRLMRISLLQFFKTFQNYLAYAFFGVIISLLCFLCDTQNIEITAVMK